MDAHGATLVQNRIEIRSPGAIIFALREEIPRATIGILFHRMKRVTSPATRRKKTRQAVFEQVQRPAGPALQDMPKFVHEQVATAGLIDPPISQNHLAKTNSSPKRLAGIDFQYDHAQFQAGPSTAVGQYHKQSRPVTQTGLGQLPGKPTEEIPGRSTPMEAAQQNNMLKLTHTDGGKFKHLCLDRKAPPPGWQQSESVADKPAEMKL